MSIRWKIIWALLASALLVVLVMGGASLRLSQTTLESRATEFMKGILERNAYEISQQINSTENLVYSIYLDISSTYNLDRSLNDADYRSKYIEKVAPSVRLASELSASRSAMVLFLNPDDAAKQLGHIVYEDRDHNGIPEENTVPNWFNPNLITQVKVPENTAITYNWYTEADSPSVLCYTIVYKDQKPIVFIGAHLNKDLLKNRLRATKYLNSGFTFLNDANNQVLYHPTLKEGIDSGIASPIPKVSEGVAIGKKSDIVFNKGLSLEGNPVLRGDYLLQNDWHLGIEVQMVDILRGLDQLLMLILSVMVLALVAAALIGIYVSQRISRPYMLLSDQIEKIDQGDYDIRLDAKILNRKDEAGILARALDAMIQRQKASFEEIKHYNQNLETLVDERTTELVKAEKVASLGYLVSGVAHQINTPIGNGITTGTYLVKEVENIKRRFDEGRLGREELKDCIENVLEGIDGTLSNLNKISQLIERFKGTALLDTSENIRAHLIKTHFEDWFKIAQTRYDCPLCQLRLEIPETLSFRCRISNLRKVIEELIYNSMSHGFDQTPNPLISIRVTTIETGDLPGILLIYEDNGCGVAPSEWRHLFTPFYTTKMSRDHNGLGLNMVYNYIFGVFRGDIQMVEQEASGLVFRISLFEESARPLEKEEYQ